MRPHPSIWLRMLLLVPGWLLALPVWGSSTDQASGQVPAGIVKVTAVHIHPDYEAPWQRSSPHAVTGSGVVIADNRILTNAHIVQYHTVIEVQREGMGRRYTAELAHVCHPCDLALLTVDDTSFFEGVEPIAIGALPKLRSNVSVYGFPEGGEAVSVTSGIVSRIEVNRYSHSLEFLLLGQVDAALNSCNSGGPVVSGGKIAGVAMQTRKGAENIGYMVPAPVIEHFIEDVADGRFDGFPDLGIRYQPVENEALRTSLGLAGDFGGVLVVGVSRNGPAHDRLYPGDVLLAYDGHPIDGDGRVRLDNGLRVDCTHLEQRKQVGAVLVVDLLRDGRKQRVEVPMARVRDFVPKHVHDKPPRYFVFAGVVFQPLTLPYLQRFRSPPPQLMRYATEYTAGPFRAIGRSGDGDPRDEVILISAVLADEINRGYSVFEGEVVSRINGQPVRDLDQLVARLEKASGPNVEIITEDGGVITLDLAAAKARGPRILAKYGVRADRYLTGGWQPTGGGS